MDFMTDKQKQVIDKFKANVAANKKGTSNFTRSDYQHLERVKHKIMNFIKYYDEGLKLYLFLEEN